MLRFCPRYLADVLDLIYGHKMNHLDGLLP